MLDEKTTEEREIIVESDVLDKLGKDLDKSIKSNIDKLKMKALSAFIEAGGDVNNVKKAKEYISNYINKILKL